MAWLEKFCHRNKENIKELDLKIEELGNNLSTLLVSSEMFCVLQELEESNDLLDGSWFMYKNIVVCKQPFFQAGYVGFITRDFIKQDLNYMIFDVPCVCGLYKDEPHTYYSKKN